MTVIDFGRADFTLVGLALVSTRVFAMMRSGGDSPGN